MKTKTFVTVAVLATTPFSALLYAEETITSPDPVSPIILDLSPTDELEHDSKFHGMTQDVAAPGDAPSPTTILERNGVDPDISAGADSLAASQRIGLGERTAADQAVSIQPYIELGADVAASDDNFINGGSGLATETNATLGGGTTVNVNEQIDLRLGYTRKEPVSGGSLDVDGEDTVETGVSIKF